MHIDLEHSGLPNSFECSVCLIGAGIAGLTLASRLSEYGIDIHLLEAGGLTLEDRSQALFQAEMPDERHTGAYDGRFRLFGGSSTRWGGQILPFTGDIFSPPPGTASMGWPIGEDELSPYYDAICRLLGVNDLPFTSDLLRTLGRPSVPLSDEIRLRFSKWAPFSKRNMARTVGKRIIGHPQVTLFTHANVTSFAADPLDRSRITSVGVLNYSGKQFTFHAERFILCAGTIESCRLLLCSPDVPNPCDQIGRYFHDHVALHAAHFVSPARERILERLGPFFLGGTLHTCKLEATPELREREHLLAAMAHIVVVEPEDSGIAAVRNLLRSMQHGHLGEALKKNLPSAVRGVADVARLLLYSRFANRRMASHQATLYLNIDLEQAPNPENRIRTSRKVDALGRPVAVVDWRIGKLEKETACHYSRIIHCYLQSLELDPGAWETSLFRGIAPPMSDTFHAMGGLRMGDDPATSAVDTELTVHGLSNLSVASCAVFPSGGSSNPTFTMMALALRLASRIGKELSAMRSDPASAPAGAVSMQDPTR